MDHARGAELLREEVESAFAGLSRLSDLECPGVLYHYTSVVGLMGMVEKREIWASHSAFMNDPSELRHADDHIRQAVELIGPEATGLGQSVFARFLSTHPNEGAHSRLDVFVASFSAEGDSLPQWRAYADDGKGYAIGVDTTYGGARQDPFPCGNHGDYVVDLYKVEYSVKTALAELCGFLRKVLTVVDDCARRGADPKVIELIAARNLWVRMLHESVRYKHEAFQHENEWRFVVIGKPNRKNRACRGIPLPYVPVALAEDGHRLPIQHVRIGPAHATGGKLLAAKLGVIDLLDGKCMRSDVDDLVCVSSIPYQSW